MWPTIIAAIDAEQVRRQHERAEDVVRDTSAGVAEDFRVAGLEAEHRQRLNPRVHAGEDGEPSRCDGLEPLEPEPARVRLVCGQHVVERLVGGHGRIVGERGARLAKELVAERC